MTGYPPSSLLTAIAGGVTKDYKQKAMTLRFNLKARSAGGAGSSRGRRLKLGAPARLGAAARLGEHPPPACLPVR